MLLVYGITNEKLAFIKDLAGSFQIPIRVVSEEETLYTAGCLAGLEDADQRKFVKEDFPEDIEFLLFCQLDRKTLYNFIDQAKENGYVFPHKAILTETTKNWPFSYLLGHIAQEHKLSQAYQRLGKKIKNLNQKNQGLIQEAKDLAKMGEDLTLDHIFQVEEKVDQALKAQ